MQLSNIKMATKALKFIYRKTKGKIKNITNPIVKKECIGTKVNEFGDEVSIFRTKRIFGKAKISEKEMPKQIGLSEELLKEESILAWEYFFGDPLINKKIELTPQLLKQVESLIAKGIINKQYAEIFKKNINKEGTSFIESCYHDLAKSMGYKKYPELGFIDFYSSSTFNPRTIKISPSAFPTKQDQIAALRHELEHFRQEELVYRVFGEEKYINAKINPNIEKLKINEDFCIKKFGKKFAELSEQEITQYKSDLYNRIKESCSVFKDAKTTAVKLTKQEITEAEKYIKGIENYKIPDMVLNDIDYGEIDKLKTSNPKLFKLAQDYCVAYNSNPLEQGARAKENEIGKMFESFIALFI